MLKKIFYNTHILVALHVALLISIGFLLINADYQKRFYRHLVSEVVTEEMSEKEVALALMGATHEMVYTHYDIFNGNALDRGFKSNIFNSSQEVITSGPANCGDMSHMLGRSLKEAGYEFRIAQMKVGDTYGGHILVEAVIDGKWAVLDPLFNLAFEKEDGSLASFKEVGDNWNYFKNQVPEDYLADLFTYEDVRYTNWGKIPIIIPLVKKVVVAAIGEDATRKISLRAYVLESYKVRALGLAFLYLGVAIWTVFVLRRRSKIVQGRTSDD